MNFESKSLRTSSVTSTSIGSRTRHSRLSLWPTGPTALTSRSASSIWCSEMPSSRKAGTSRTKARFQDIARELGIVMPDESDRAAVVADWHEGQRHGVHGSPHFFCGDDDVFCPSLDITKSPVKGLSIVRDTSRSGIPRTVLACPGSA